jgi:hypothetical protein
MFKKKNILVGRKERQFFLVLRPQSLLTLDITAANYGECNITYIFFGNLYLVSFCLCISQGMNKRTRKLPHAREQFQLHTDYKLSHCCLYHIV